MRTNRALRVLLGVLAIASCRDPSSRADAASAGAGGTGPSGGSGGSGGALGDASGGGVSGAGSGGAGIPIDASVDSGDTDDVREAGAALEPIRVSGGDPDAAVVYSDLRFIGVGLEQYEGAVVTFRIGSPSGGRRIGSGQVRVVQGAFDVLFPGVLAPVYEQKLVHIDADGSGACEVDEPMFVDYALSQTDWTVTVTPADVRFRPALSGWCDVINNGPVPP